MRLSKTAYYADFYIYAFAAVDAFLWSITGSNSSMRLKAIVACIVGAATWTLLEYLLHRFVLHGISPIAALHKAHHTEPRAYIGTPTWLSAGIIGSLVYLPLWLTFSVPIAAGFTAGFMLAFLWYGVVHHLIHHGAPRLLAPLLRGTAKRHARHHSSLGMGNFGVTTGFWDRTLGTQLAPRKAPCSARISPA